MNGGVNVFKYVQDAHYLPCCVLYVHSGNLFADTIEFEKGKKIEGELYVIKDGFHYFKIHKSQVDRVRYASKTVHDRCRYERWFCAPLPYNGVCGRLLLYRRAVKRNKKHYQRGQQHSPQEQAGRNSCNTEIANKREHDPAHPWFKYSRG